MSARADDQQVGAASLLDEHLGGLASHYSSLDLDAVGLSAERGERRLQRRARAALEVCRINVRTEYDPSVGHRRQMPGCDHPQPGASQRRLPDRDAKRFLRAI